MTNTILFSTGLFCFFLAIVGVVLTAQEFKNMELKEKLKKKKYVLDFRISISPRRCTMAGN